MEYIFLAVLAALLLFIVSMFRPVRTGAVTGNIFAARNVFVNFYVIEADNRVLLFDTGVSKALAKRSLQKLGFSPIDVTHIFLTHTDFDHAGGIKAFPNAEVYISCEEEQMINGTTNRKLFLKNRIPERYHLMKHGDILETAGKTVEVFLCEGHTPGSVIYLVDKRFCICGDLLRITRNGAFKPFLRLMNMEHKTNVESLKKMNEILSSSEYVMTGHTGYIRNNIS